MKLIPQNKFKCQNRSFSKSLRFGFLFISFGCYFSPIALSAQEFITTDLNNFWAAYDRVVALTDSTAQYKVIYEEYIAKGTEGLSLIMEARNYSPEEMVSVIRSYPKFWASIRPNMQQVEEHLHDIEADLGALKSLYPDMKPAPIYFSVGAFRTNGTVSDGKVLIGAEVSLANDKIYVAELPDWRQPFYATNPVKGLALLCTHEYVHTQQAPIVHNLLSKCLYEGIAEFVSCKATGKPSAVEAIQYGKDNTTAVTAQFVEDMFLFSHDSNWLWAENTNQFKVRDLGYFIGYEIAERYYLKSSDKKEAIKTLVELDFTNEPLVEKVVDGSGLLPNTLDVLYEAYEQQRPTVVGIQPFDNEASNVKPGLTSIQVFFSVPLNGQNTSVDYGPLGADAFPKLIGERVWAADAKSWTIQAQLEPNMEYQILISNNFRLENQVRLKPFLIHFKTGDR